MIYYEVLNRREQELWDLVSYLADPTRFVNESVLCSELDLTEFTLEQRRETTNEIWLKLFGEPLTKGRFGLNDSVYVRDERLLRFLHYLLENSLGNTMLLQFFLDRYDLKSFMTGQQISQASTYRIRREVHEALQEYDLSLTGNFLSGNEETIRNLMMEVLNFRDLDLKELAGHDLYEQAQQTVSIIADHYAYDLRLTERDLLLNLMVIVMIRHRAGHFLTDDIPMELDQHAEALLHKLEPYFTIPPENYVCEAHRLIMFLYAYGLVDSVSLLENDEVQMIQRVNHACQELFIKTFYTKIETDLQQQKMVLGFDRIHWRNHLYPIFHKNFGFFQDETWYETFRPLFQMIDEIYLKNHMLAPGFLKSTESRYKLYYDYFYIWVTYSYNKSDMEKIYLCADFTQTSAMNKILEQIFNGIWFSNLIVQDHIDERTDIYLSDRLIADLTLPQIVWLNPPHYRELLDLMLG